MSEQELKTPNEQQKKQSSSGLDKNLKLDEMLGKDEDIKKTNKKKLEKTKKKSKKTKEQPNRTAKQQITYDKTKKTLEKTLGKIQKANRKKRIKRNMILLKYEKVVREKHSLIEDTVLKKQCLLKRIKKIVKAHKIQKDVIELVAAIILERISNMCDAIYKVETGINNVTLSPDVIMYAIKNLNVTSI